MCLYLYMVNKGNVNDLYKTIVKRKISLRILVFCIYIFIYVFIFIWWILNMPIEFQLLIFQITPFVDVDSVAWNSNCTATVLRKRDLKVHLSFSHIKHTRTLSDWGPSSFSTSKDLSFETLEKDHIPRTTAQTSRHIWLGAEALKHPPWDPALYCLP